MLLFPHDLMLMMRANVARLRTTVQVDPVATMFGGDDNLAIAMLRIRPEITRGVVHAPNLLAIALGSPCALPVPEEEDMSDDETIQGAEDRMREAMTEAAKGDTKTHTFFVYGSRQMAVGGVLRIRDTDESALDLLVEGIHGMHRDLAAGMGGSSHLTIERI